MLTRNQVFIRALLLIGSAVLSIALIAGFHSNRSTEAARGVGGELDLRNWDLEDNVRLNGEWQLYWQKLLHYGDSELQEPGLIVEVPKSWHEYTWNGEQLPAIGYGTYRLHIKTDLPEGTPMGLNLYTFSSAFQLYVDDQLIATSGEVSADPSQEIGEHKPQIVFFATPDEEFDILIQVSNARYNRGGFWYSAWLGHQSSIVDQHNMNLVKEGLLVGALSLIGFFYLMIYSFRREFKLALYFSLLCLMIGVTLDMLGQFLLTRFMSGISIDVVLFIFYTSSTWLIFFLVLYFHELFVSRLSKLVLRVIAPLTVILQLIYIFTPLEVYAQTMPIRNVLAVVSVFLVFVITATRIRHKRQNALYSAVGMVLLFITYVHDILYWYNWIDNPLGEMAYVGIMVFVLTQILVHARLISDFHERKVATELSFLQAQIKPHFLYNTINTFISISYDDIEKARELIFNFSDYLRRSFDLKSSDQFASLSHEVKLVQAYVEIEKVRFDNQVEVYFHLPNDLACMVPILMMQPVVENAILHGVLPKGEKGEINIHVREENKALLFVVKDNGVGMDQAKINDILIAKEDGRVGLININNRLQKLFRRGLVIRSDLGQGTEVSWQIPKRY